MATPEASPQVPKLLEYATPGRRGRMRVRSIAVLLLLVLLASLWSSAEGTPVTYKSGDENVNGVVFMPSGKGPFPALIVIHEWWGLNDWVKDEGSKLAQEGYVTLAIDLYRGKVATTPEEAHEIMRGVPPDRANRDLKAAYGYLASRKDVDRARIGSIGWCMGGGYSLDAALLEPHLAATVINYGHLETDPTDLKKINAAILGIFGGQDRGIPVADVKKFEQELKQLGKKVEIVIYPDAGHAFENPNNKDGYRPKDAEDAWNKTINFLAANLKRARARHMQQAPEDYDEVEDARVRVLRSDRRCRAAPCMAPDDGTGAVPSAARKSTATAVELSAIPLI
jgi:carboxymethylenebutenolidase